ncbi:MAG: hypothetical protein J6U58_04870 [Bacteroidaceae bacterium]|nr:hypothetical protein [Bacteroidaceae bacterium]
MKKSLLYIMLLALSLTFSSCASRKKNNATTRAYHAITAKYNTWYNGNKAYNQALKSQIEGHKDNYLEQLPLLITSSKVTQGIGRSNYDKAIEKSQKAIKNHSIKKRPKRPAGKKLTPKQKLFYSQNEFNPFLWRVWFLMANSQAQQGLFAEAASTYIYITRLYENNPNIVAQARIGLAKCYTEMEWLYEAEELLRRVQHDSIPQSLENEFARTKAHLVLKQEKNEEAIELIQKSIKRKKITTLEKAREYYLLGQLQAKKGDMKAAYKSFGKTIAAGPPYELEFNARIRQTETATDENHKKILRKLKRMTRSDKNKDYLAQIYYAIGNIHLSKKDTAEALKNYETGVAVGATSGYGTAMLHKSLAKLYWNDEKFSKAHENYTKALPLINEENDDYDEIKFRSEVLASLTPHTDIVEKQDKLLHWATLSDEELYPIIDKLIEEEKLKEELRKKEEKKLKREEQGDSDENTTVLPDLSIPEPGEKAEWYFYNRKLVTQGMQAFKNTWGNRPLKDYWRFSNEISSFINNEELLTDSTELVDGDENLAMDSTEVDFAFEEEIADTLSTDPTTREFYLQQIPRTEEKVNEARNALYDALFASGVIFKDNVNDKDLTISYLERIPKENPEFERMAETYFQLFMACSRWNEPEKAEYYKNLLIENYPDSTITKNIQRPEFFDNAETRRHKEDSIYVKAYNHYMNNEYEQVEYEESIAGDRYPNGNHRARFMFIDAMAKLYGGKQYEALETLEKLVSKFSADSLTSLATDITTGIKEGRLLHSGISTSIWNRKADGTIKDNRDSIPPFSTNIDEPHYFILAFPNDEVDEKRLLFEIARYNFSRYMVRKFEMSFEKLAEITLFQVKEFLNYDEVFLYRKRLYENRETARLLEGINSLIISKTNLDLLLQYYSFDDYIKFYEENLLDIPEIEIDGYTLDEPEL